MNEIYTVYWENKRDGIRKKHGSFLSEVDAKRAIETWWDIENKNYRNVQEIRTNTGALEFVYLESDPNYVYRIEKELREEPLADTHYRLMNKNEIQALHKKYNLSENEFLFDELAEPYRDRLIFAIADIKKARSYCYEEHGRVIRLIEEK